MKKNAYKLKTAVLKSMANPIRLMIIDCLKSGEKNVSEIIDITEEEQSTISKSLSILRNNGIIKDRKVGLNVFYSLNLCCLTQFLDCMDNIISENLQQQQNLLNYLENEKD